MSVSGARRARELTEKYAQMVYGKTKGDRLVKSIKRISFCPRCKSYIPPHSKCRNCGYEPEEYLIMKKKTEKKKTVGKSHTVQG